MSEQPTTYKAPEERDGARWYWDRRFLTPEQQERMRYEDLRPDPGTPYGFMGEPEEDQEQWEDGQRSGCGRRLGDLFLYMMLICAVILLIYILLLAFGGSR